MNVTVAISLPNLTKPISTFTNYFSICRHGRLDARHTTRVTTKLKMSSATFFVRGGGILSLITVFR